MILGVAALLISTSGAAIDIRDRAPIISEESAKPVNVIAACVAETMSRSGGSSVATNLLVDGASVVASANTLSGISAFTIVDVRRRNGMSHVEVRVRGRQPKDGRKTYSNLIACL